MCVRTASSRAQGVTTIVSNKLEGKLYRQHQHQHQQHHAQQRQCYTELTEVSGTDIVVVPNQYRTHTELIPECPVGY